MIAIVDYGAGNLTSVRLALEAIGAEAVITQDPATVRAARRVIFPGVGAAGAAMRSLRDLGLAEPIRQVAAAGVPFLGICLGTQIVFDFTEEDGGTQGLGIAPGRVRLFRPSNPSDKVPHMGWNDVRIAAPHPLLAGIEDGSEFYFVHSYYPDPSDPAWILGRTTHAGATFASIVAKGNVVATQFHPEKSGRIGLHLLRNFCAWDGKGATPC
jgi:glutamine amidotransferase